METSETILVERRGPVTIFTINRPASMNALDQPSHFRMSDELDRFAGDPEQWVAIITAAGDRAFCAGNDLKQQLGPDDPLVPQTGFAGITARFDCDKPIIAAINGMAMGGGFEIALACDLVIAAEHAVFGFPEVRVGRAAMAGGLLRLPLAIGMKRAMEMILTAKRISAAEALALGLINQVVPPGQALAAALAMADTLLIASPLSLRASKAVIGRALDGAIQAAMHAHLDYPEIVQMMASEDAIEGTLAFQEKRPPRWVGR